MGEVEVVGQDRCLGPRVIPDCGHHSPYSQPQTPDCVSLVLIVLCAPVHPYHAAANALAPAGLSCHPVWPLRGTSRLWQREERPRTPAENVTQGLKCPACPTQRSFRMNVELLHLIHERALVWGHCAKTMNILTGPFWYLSVFASVGYFTENQRSQ